MGKAKHYGGITSRADSETNLRMREAARAIRAEVNGDLTPEDLDFPTVDDGLEGMAFITAAVQSAKAGGVWAKMPATLMSSPENRSKRAHEKICSFADRRMASFPLEGRVFFFTCAGPSAGGGHTRSVAGT
jgi:hypothetical protein